MSSEPAILPSSVPAAAAPRTFKLPNARHASRVPEAITPADVARIQQAAYQLPQVVKPADYIDEHAPHFEQHLDTLGLILLQKAVAGSRPSRWIAPDRMADALRHLEAVGNGPQVRALMQARTVELEGLGVTRDAGEFDRFLTQDLTLPSTGWPLRVAYRQPVPAAPVWAFYRYGDLDAFKVALGDAPLHADAAAMVDHIESLVARGMSGHPEHITSMLPRLQ